MTRKSRATGSAGLMDAVTLKRTPSVKQAVDAGGASPSRGRTDRTKAVLCDLRWDRDDPSAGRILLHLEDKGRFVGSVQLPGAKEEHRRAEHLSTLIGWLEDLPPPVPPLGVASMAQGERLAEDQLEDLLLLAANRALRDKFDQLRGEALAIWSEIEGKDCR